MVKPILKFINMVILKNNYSTTAISYDDCDDDSYIISYWSVKLTDTVFFTMYYNTHLFLNTYLYICTYYEINQFY